MPSYDPFGTVVYTDEEQRILDEQERRRREEEAARAQLGQPKSTTIINNDDGTQTVKTTHELDAAAAAGPVAPTSYDSFGNPAMAGSAAATQADPTGEIAAYQEQVRQQQLAQAEQQRQMAAAEAARQAASVEAAAAPAPAPAPVAPTPMQMPTRPGQQTSGVDTQALYQRMLQQESGNQDYYPAGHPRAGQPVTSPSGALFAGQVLPSTAASPGYGIKPAASQTPEEYNRVGREYYNAMLDKYGNDAYKAAAAYNAGPGRIDKLIAANNGQLPYQYLPQETQKYLQNIGVGPNIERAPFSGGTVRGAISPEQVAVAKPGEDSEGYPIDAQGNRLGRNGRRLDANGNEIPGEMLPLETGTVPSSRVAPLEVAPPAYRDLNDAVSKENIQVLAQGMASQDPALRRASGEALQSLLNQKQGAAEAAKKIEALQNSPNPGLAITKELSKKSGDEGSYLKMFLYQLMNWTGLAKDEAIKLGMGAKYETGMRTNPDTGALEYGLVKVDGRGMPLSGIKADGTDMTPQEQVQFASQAMGMKGLAKADVSLQDVEKDGMKGRVVTRNLPGGTTQTYVESGGKQYPYGSDWKPVSIATAGAKMDIKYMNTLREKFGTDVIGGYTQFLKDNPSASLDEKQQVATYLGLKPEALAAVGLAPGAAPAPVVAPPPPAAAPPAAAAPVPVSGAVSPESIQAPPAAALPAAALPAAAAPPAAAAVLPVAPSAIRPAAPPPAAATTVSAGGVSVPPMPVRTAGMGEAEYKAKMAAWNTAVAEANRISGEIAAEAGKSPIRINEEDVKRFMPVKEAINNDATAGDTISDVKIAQQQIIKSSPGIVGMLTGTGAGYDALRSLVLTGGSDDAHRQAVALAIRKVGITDPKVIDDINRYDAQQGRINGALVRQNLPGIQRITQNEFNYTKGSLLANITTSTPAAVLENNGREQLIGDLSRAKADYVAKNNLQTSNQLEAAWPKQQDMLFKEQAFIQDARAKWVANELQKANIAQLPTSSSDPKYGVYVNKLLQSYDVYPAPKYDRQTQSWNYGTKEAFDAVKAARMKSILGR